MNQRISVLVIGAMLLALCVTVEAQQPKKLPRIGYLSTSDAGADTGRFNGIRQHLLLESGKFEINVSVPLIFEYEEGAKRLVGKKTGLRPSDVDDILDYVCSVANRRKVYYLWLPFLKDPKDDMVLELAVSAGCNFIVTYIKDDFTGVEQFGVRVMTAQEFLRVIGELP